MFKFIFIGFGILVVFVVLAVKLYPLILVTEYEESCLFDYDFRYNKNKEKYSEIILKRTIDLKGHASEAGCVLGVQNLEQKITWIFLNPLGWKKLIYYPNDDFNITTNEYTSIVDFCETNSKTKNFLKKKIVD